MHRFGCWLICAALLFACVEPSAAQRRGEAPVGYVTVVTGDGATRGESGPAFPQAAGEFNQRASGVSAGESISTLPGASAVIWLPAYRIAVHMNSDSLVSLPEIPGLADHVAVSVAVQRGRVHVVRSPSDNAWLLVSAGTEEAFGYTLSKGASLVVEAVEFEAAFTVSRGDEALFFEGPVPSEGLIGGEGEPLDDSGTSLSEGQRVSTQVPTVTESRASASAAWDQTEGDLYVFALDQGGQWVARAEEGDFTPVRAEAAATPRTFGAEVGIPRQAFDQPRTVVTSPVTRTTVSTTVTAQRSAVENLLASQIPGSVVVGQRIRRSRIIGTDRRIGFNPFAEQLLLLSGRPGLR